MKEPIIYALGVTHGEYTPLDKLRDWISNVHEKGVRTIGIEIISDSSIRKYPEREDEFFKNAKKYAQELGIKVIPLESSYGLRAQNIATTAHYARKDRHGTDDLIDQGLGIKGEIEKLKNLGDSHSEKVKQLEREFRLLQESFWDAESKKDLDTKHRAFRYIRSKHAASRLRLALEETGEEKGAIIAGAGHIPHLPDFFKKLEPPEFLGDVEGFKEHGEKNKAAYLKWLEMKKTVRQE